MARWGIRVAEQGQDIQTPSGGGGEYNTGEGYPDQEEGEEDRKTQEGVQGPGEGVPG